MLGTISGELGVIMWTDNCEELKNQMFLIPQLLVEIKSIFWIREVLCPLLDKQKLLSLFS